MAMPAEATAEMAGEGAVAEAVAEAAEIDAAFLDKL
jgi:hypothetical protein